LVIYLFFLSDYSGGKDTKKKGIFAKKTTLFIGCTGNW